jgi:putative ABC transport system permease protein
MDDLRQAFRGLRKQRGFTAVAILTLAFGIGVNVALFSLVSAFFFQPLPVHDPHQLVVVMQRSDLVNIPYGHSYPDYRDFREAVKTFSDLAAYMPTPVHLGARGQAPERTWIEVVSPNYFSLAGVTPAFGSFPRMGQDEATGAPSAVVLSYRYWQRRFGGNPAMVGQPITLNGRAFTVIGIAPESFTGLSWAMAVSGFVPSGAAGALMENGDAFRDNRGIPAWRLMGRLVDGATIDEARAEVEVVATRLASTYPAEHKDTSRIALIPENRSRPDPSVAGFLPIFAAVFAIMAGLVLLIACANVANLMLARAVARQRDLVIRSALGASRSRLVRLQVIESLILAAVAGAIGVLLAQWAGQALAGFTPSGDIPINEQQPQDWRAYVFTFLVSAAAGVVTGVWPALKATRFDVVESLKEGSTGAGTSRHRLRSLLVIGQVTMSLVVLVTGGLFLHSLRQMQGLDVGFRPKGLLTASIDLGLQQYSGERGRQFLDDLVTRVEALPGVESASLTTHVPFDYGIVFADVGIEGEIPGSKDGLLSTAYGVVGSTFFETARASIVRGRGFNRHDDEKSLRVGVVNDAMARKLWPGRDAIGQRFRFGSKGEWIVVVGIARDGKYLMLTEPPRPYCYVPIAQNYRSPVTLLVRTASDDPAALAGPLRRLLGEMDPDLPVFNVRTMTNHMRDSVFAFMPFRMAVALAGAQGAVGLLLAVMGLYAVVSYTVTRRTREIGVRMALGANRTDVLRLVIRDGMRLSLIGVAIGLLMALGIGLVLSQVLYGVTPVDAAVLASVTALLLGVSAFACYAPARRATRVDPLTALRCE